MGVIRIGSSSSIDGVGADVGKGLKALYQEVRVSLNKHLLDDLTSGASPGGTGRLRLNMARTLREEDTGRIRHILQSLFSSWWDLNLKNSFQPKCLRI